MFVSVCVCAMLFFEIYFSFFVSNLIQGVIYVHAQAYTQELEIKVKQLEEENERLRRLNVCL